MARIDRTPTQEYATLAPEQLTPTNSADGRHNRHHSGKQRKIKTHASDEPVLLDDITNRQSMQLPRHSEDDDLERGVQEITVAMNEPEGSFSGLTTDEAIT